MRKMLLFFGGVFVFIGLLFNLRIFTGNVVSSFEISSVSFSSIWFFVVGFILMLFGVLQDSLQERLQEMEGENPSQSGISQRRSLGDYFKTRFRKVEKINSREIKYPEVFQGTPIFINGQGPFDRYKQGLDGKKELEGKFLELKYKLYNFIKESKDLEKSEGRYSGRRSNLSESQLNRIADELKGTAKKLGMPEQSLSNYLNLGAKRLGAYYDPKAEKISNRINNMLTKERIGKDELHSLAYQYIEAKKRGSPPESKEIRKLVDDYVDQYEKGADTVPVKEILSNDRFLVSGLTLFPGSQDKARMRINNSSFWEEKKNQINSDDFGNFILGNILKQKPQLSGSVVNTSSGSNSFFQPYGFILDDGKIYDASAFDLVTVPHGSKRTRIPQLSNPKLIRERVNDTLNNLRENSINEFVIGGDYGVKGLYVIPGDVSEEHLNYVSNLSKKYGLPLFYFEKGKGFFPPETLKKSIGAKKVSKKIR